MKRISIIAILAFLGGLFALSGGAFAQDNDPNTPCSEARPDYCPTQEEPTLVVRGARGGRLIVPTSARGFNVNGKRLNCAVRNFTFRARVNTPNPIQSARVFVDNKLIKTTTSKNVKALVPVRSLKRGTHRLRLVVTDEAVSRSTSSVRFSVCARAAGLPTRRPGFTG